MSALDTSEPLAAARAGRWPPLLGALRRTVRPDRSRVAAYVSFARSPGAWADYGGFLARHRAWLAALDGALAPRLPEVASSPARAGEAAAAAAGALPPARSRAEALGYLYVREAFRLGSEALSRALGGPGQETAEDPEAEVPARRSWRELVRALADVAAPDEQAEVLEGARSAFAAWERRLAPSLERLGLVEEPASACQA